MYHRLLSMIRSASALLPERVQTSCEGQRLHILIGARPASIRMNIYPHSDITWCAVRRTAPGSPSIYGPERQLRVAIAKTKGNISQFIGRSKELIGRFKGVNRTRLSVEDRARCLRAALQREDVLNSELNLDNKLGNERRGLWGSQGHHYHLACKSARPMLTDGKVLLWLPVLTSITKVCSTPAGITVLYIILVRRVRCICMYMGDLP